MTNPIKTLQEQNKLLREEIMYLKNALCKCPEDGVSIECPVHKREYYGTPTAPPPVIKLLTFRKRREE